MKPFENIFGKTDELKILEEFLPFEEEMEFTVVEIAQFSGVSIENTVEILDKFMKWNIVKILIVSNEWVNYKINVKSNIVKAFNEINLVLINKIINDEEEAEIQIKKYYCKECDIYFQKNQLTGTIGNNKLLCPECYNIIEIK